ncbi:MAG: succinate dehydrogenase assembly factor 2 [Acetobacter sp.]|jgi:antitoxin CptB|nr:succinate dehydrogenase assembly factor 2 [Acetobacter sp.]MCH4060757.1 succinate dehydrogenase assembly factor 2 [Acetobacter sp.]MCH4087697.1 succinate dehydrogenase assembly factor 2 [Acetobacter sp.]MCI1294380.1 succinate dehydrogenase assembly factor 2 [Acetobacter sp.]MCI1321030.1 succinate dehydrogenase assembly factor 2 [Acetobacter sp.]
MEQNETNISAVASATTDDGLAVRRRRLSFRAVHRGTQETDLLIGGFVEAHVAQMGDAELTDMEQVLEIPDPELADWLTGRLALPEERATPMLRRMHTWCIANVKRV